MRDHRPDLDGEAPQSRELREITEQVHQYSTKHPGSLKRSDANRARKAAKQAKASRKANR